mmetsp:Transcript_1650/g.3564  ORF Transcript_1650/g.3564 Transcript_1650/m.3564 type:complete len:235 (-) Transcript_1650:467-1171(-)
MTATITAQMVVIHISVLLGRAEAGHWLDAAMALTMMACTGPTATRRWLVGGLGELLVPVCVSATLARMSTCVTTDHPSMMVPTAGKILSQGVQVLVCVSATWVKATTDGTMGTMTRIAGMILRAQGVDGLASGPAILVRTTTGVMLSTMIPTAGKTRLGLVVLAALTMITVLGAMMSMMTHTVGKTRVGQDVHLRRTTTLGWKNTGVKMSMATHTAGRILALLAVLLNNVVTVG